MRGAYWNLSGISVLIAFLAAWHLVSVYQMVPALFLPGPIAVTASLQELLASNRVWRAIALTIQHMAGGWLLACALGIAFGAAVAASATGRSLFEPTLNFMRTLPSAAILPAFILIFGLSDTMIVAVIAFGAVWPILLGTIQGFSNIDARMIEVGRVLGLSLKDQFFELRLPAAMPNIVSSARIALSLSLILAIVTEMASGVGGLGNVVLRAARDYRSADVFAGIVLIAVLGLITSAALEAIESKLVRESR